MRSNQKGRKYPRGGSFHGNPLRRVKKEEASFVWNAAEVSLRHKEWEFSFSVTIGR